MIRSITVINARDELLEIPLTKPERSGLGLQSITGVGSPQMNIITTNSFYDGSRLGHIRAEQRNIVLTFFPMAYPSVETSRQMLYRYFPVHSQVTLMFNLDNRDVSIKGYVESIEPNIFEVPETVSISVICTRPFFESYIPTVLNFWEAVPLFEFPFSNESLTEPLLEFGETSSKTSVNVDYMGDISGGMRLIMRGMGANNCNFIHIYNMTSNEHMTISRDLVEKITNPYLNVGSLAHQGLVYTLDTTPGRQSLTLLWEQGDSVFNILPALGREIDWVYLYPGKQEIVIQTDLPSTVVEPIRTSIEYKTRYVGI